MANDRHPTRVLVVDQLWVVRDGLTVAVNGLPSFIVSGSASSLADAMRLLRKTPRDFDVLIIDAVVGDESGMNAIPDIRRSFPDLAILVYTSLPEQPHAVRALEQGADAFVAKSGSRDELIEALQILAQGKRYISPTVAQLLADRLNSKDALTARETEVVRYLATGYRSGEIAKRLSLSPKTISAHKANAMAKLGLRSNADLIRWAIDNIGA